MGWCGDSKAWRRVLVLGFGCAFCCEGFLGVEMSTFRRPKPEAAFLYSLPRRELQALCKQYRIAANKTNNAMADALSAHVPVSISVCSQRLRNFRF